MTHEQIIETLEAAFAGQLSDCDTAHGISAITIPAASNLKVLQFLFDSEDLQFRFLTDLTAVHYPNRTNEELCVVYHLHSLHLNKRLRIKCLQRLSFFLVPTGWSAKLSTFTV